MCFGVIEIGGLNDGEQKKNDHPRGDRFFLSKKRYLYRQIYPIAIFRLFDNAAERHPLDTL